jgi:hypothetical protein
LKATPALLKTRVAGGMLKRPLQRAMTFNVIETALFTQRLFAGWFIKRRFF